MSRRLDLRWHTHIAVDRRSQFLVGYIPLCVESPQMWPLASRMWEPEENTGEATDFYDLVFKAVVLAVFHLLESSHGVRPMLKKRKQSPSLKLGKYKYILQSSYQLNRSSGLCRRKRKTKYNLLSLLRSLFNPPLFILPSN